jgi:hypothetical protein
MLFVGTAAFEQFLNRKVTMDPGLSGSFETHLKERFSYDWRTQEVDVGGSDFWLHISDETKIFLWEATGWRKETKPISLREMYGNPWRNRVELLDDWLRLPRRAQLEALVFLLGETHETTHHVDFLCTPFAVNLYTKVIREYTALQDFAPALLKRPELLPSRLIDFETHAASQNIRADDSILKLWRPVRAQLLSLVSYGVGSQVRPRDSIEVGWAGNRDPLYLFGESFERILVNGFLTTVRRSGDSAWFLSPLTFIENRAVANMVAFALYFVGESAGPVVADLIRILYRSEQAQTEYLFVLDLLSRFHGYRDFEDAIITASYFDLFHHILLNAEVLGWYALHAPPMTNKVHLFATNPVLRFIVGVKSIEDVIRKGSSSQRVLSAAEFLDNCDATELAQKLHIATAAEALQQASEVVCVVANGMVPNTKNSEMRTHFAAVLGRLALCLKARSGTYDCDLGIPEFGTPFAAREMIDDKVGRAITTDLDPPISVREWFKFRDSLCFSFQLTRSQKIEGLRKQFGSRSIRTGRYFDAILNSKFARSFRLSRGR